MEAQPKPLAHDDDSALEAAIGQQESRLEEIRRQQEEAEAAVARLRARLRSRDDLRPEPATIPRAAPPRTASEKVALFRSLFRGRADIYARLWSNPRTGKKGYAPACANEWVRGICEKPRIRCGECPNQAFLPVTDQVVLGHLKGQHVIGVYPLLADDNCWLLAVDFDKNSWTDDVGAFAETCRRAGVPVSVERSRSGKGAHAWFFFSAPVLARAARDMASSLLTETMARRPELGMASYDRLFPSQDTLPRGGFGNLIALPLQHGSRQQGNTVFLDNSLAPYADQWAYLAHVARIDPHMVEAIASAAMRSGRILGVRRYDADEDEDHSQPWLNLPSGPGPLARLTGPFPERVRAVLAQRLFVEKEGLPAALVDRIRRLAAFQNPEFYERQRLRLSTRGTPRVICCAGDSPRHIVLPRGCHGEVDGTLREQGVELVVDDQRVLGEPIELRFQGQLTSVQEEATRAVLAHDMGLVVAPPGVGKTVIGVQLIAQRARNALVLVHRRPLLDQWVAQLAVFLGLDSKAIGRMGGERHRVTGRIDVAMIQSLVRRGRVDDNVARYGHVLVDECHHVPAVSFERVMAEVKARYVTGLTATPRRRDGHHPILGMQLGPARYTVNARSGAARRPFRHRLVVRETSFLAPPQGVGASIQELYRLLAADEQRNQLILNDVIQALEDGRTPLVLTERKDHLDYFAERLRGFTRHLLVLKGGVTAKRREGITAQLRAIPAEEERLVLATGRYAGEGFDDARLDTLFLALPIAWRGTLEQYAGRLHRLHPGKTEVCIVDYVDARVRVLAAMFRKRLKAYRAMGYRTSNPEAPVADSAGARTSFRARLDGRVGLVGMADRGD